MYVLPVAEWILRSGADAVGPSEAMVGLGGRADRPRIIEALVRLEKIGALRELPRTGRRAPRIFERVKNPYWSLVATHLADSGAASSSFG
jgi:hypothetical protein